jgi:hypothetical protein
MAGGLKYLHEVVNFLDDFFGRLERFNFQVGRIVCHDQCVQVQIGGHSFILI